MTIRRQLLIILVLVSLFSVGVNAFVLSSLTGRYFVNYMTENYEKNLSEIIDYSKKALADNFSARQMAIELETHLDDPITRIKLYNASGQLIVDVRKDSNRMGPMMSKDMLRRMPEAPVEEIDNSQILDGGTVIGQLNITRDSSIENSIAPRLFRRALLSNSLTSIGIVLIFAILLGLFISKKISSDLIQTAAFAQNIEFGTRGDFKPSRIKEIRVIQQSLETLKIKLKLKNIGRKNLIDEVVHQSRTPLTILKNHLEGFEDKVIELNRDETKICEEQIENITAIIGNLSQVVDAEKDEATTVKIEEFDFNQMLQQIIGGMKVQFDKKAIDLRLLSQQRVVLKTDKYKLSQAIYNILTNAYKYTAPQGKVTLAYQNENDELALTIEDDGIGIGNEDQKKIFDAYYRSNDVNHISGEGIGLFIAKENLDKVQGTITVESKLGVGSKFVVKIPLDTTNH